MIDMTEMTSEHHDSDRPLLLDIPDAVPIFPPPPQAAVAPPRHGRLLGAVAATAVLSSALGAGAAIVVTRRDRVNPVAAASVAVSANPALPSDPSVSRFNITSIVARTTPSVVSIHVKTTGTDIFQQQVTQEGTGTGFVASATGLIYTNAHVVADATEVQVTMADGSTVTGKVVGVDKTDDLAVVKIDVKAGAQELVPLPIGSSKNMHVGDPVVAVGNALALPGGPTATAGIVSALNRSIDTNNGEHLARLIQTDAAINPGNSGGPLLNSAGEVIGINTAGASNAENVGFAIALDTARPILEELEQGKAHVKAFLGVRTQTVDETVVQQFNLTVKAGAYVADVTSDTAAAAAGIKVGDVITKIDDARVTSSTEVGTALSLHHPGDTVKIVLRRGDKDVIVTAKLASHNA